MVLALDMGRRLDVSLPTTAIANEWLTATRALGLGAKDFAIIFEVLARMSGLST
jgi:3-hydroxyisobutyrate dehydrogenase-like beta-hydroxyacid dehydrogenase